MKFTLFKDAIGQYRWNLKSPNGNVIADSGESYHNRSDCQRGIDLVKGSYSAPVYDGT